MLTMNILAMGIVAVAAVLLTSRALATSAAGGRGSARQVPFANLGGGG